MVHNDSILSTLRVRVYPYEFRGRFDIQISDMFYMGFSSCNLQSFSLVFVQSNKQESGLQISKLHRIRSETVESEIYKHLTRSFLVLFLSILVKVNKDWLVQMFLHLFNNITERIPPPTLLVGRLGVADEIFG